MEWSDDAIRRLYVEIGDRIRKNRGKSDLTQTGLAHAVNLTRSSIANIEAGRQRPPVHIIVMISQALDVSVHELIPSTHELDTVANISPTVDLEGMPSSSQDFVKTSLRRLVGG